MAKVSRFDKINVGNISSSVTNVLSKEVAAKSSEVASIASPFFIEDRCSNIDMTLGGTGTKEFNKFCTKVGELASTLYDAVDEAISLCEYNGSKNEQYENLEKKIFNSTYPLIYVKFGRNRRTINYVVYGAFSASYPEKDRYTTDDMVFTSKALKKRLNFKPGMALGECYKIVSEVALNKDNPYASKSTLPPDKVYDTNVAFIDVDDGTVIGNSNTSNGALCYKVVADSYLLFCFKIDINVPLYMSEEQNIRYRTLDIPDEAREYSKFADGSMYMTGPDGELVKVEALKRYYRRIMRERYNRMSGRKNSMFEARNAKLDFLDEEYAIISTIFDNIKTIRGLISSGSLKLANIDKHLRNIADAIAQLNVLVHVAKEFYGEIDSFELDASYYMNKYGDAFNKTFKKAWQHTPVPNPSLEIDLDTSKTPITLTSSDKFDEELDNATVRFLATRAGKQSSDMDKLTVDVGREGMQRASAKYEDGSAVFTVFSRTYDSNSSDEANAKLTRAPGKISGVAKLVISNDGYKIIASSNA